MSTEQKTDQESGPTSQSPATVDRVAAFTPGPWRTELGARELYHLHERRLILPPHGAESQAPIAKMNQGFDGVSEANAFLIAAAPEMYDALLSALAAIAPSDQGGISLHEWNTRLRAAVVTINAALAKAKGRSKAEGR